MIEIGIKDIVKNYGFGNILNNIKIEIGSGERIALVGQNGAGKTTLFIIITGEIAPDSGAVSIRKGATVGYLEQIPTLMTSDATVEDVLTLSFSYIKELESKLRELEKQLSEEADQHELELILKRYSHLQEQFITLDGYEIEEWLGFIISIFNLKELINRPFNVLSGGQKTVVKLAAVILKKPDILLLDEPTNHLDVKTLEWFEGYLTKYKGTVVIISHDRYFLDRVATKTVILERGFGSVFNGNYSYSLKEQERLLLLEFEEYKTQQKKVEAMKAAIKRYREWGARGDNEKFFKKAKELEKRLEKIDIITKPNLEKKYVPVSFSGERSGNDVLILEDFCLNLERKPLFNQAQLQVYVKDRICLMGDNGTGKSSLIKAIMGELDFSGKVTLNPSAKIGYIPQEIRFNDDKSTILEEFKREYICTESEARSILAKYYFFKDDVFKRVGSISGGEKVLLKLALLMQNEVNFLILDEPTNHIDIETRELLEEALLDYKGTLLFISHDRYFINKIATRIVHITEKKILNFSGKF